MINTTIDTTYLDSILKKLDDSSTEILNEGLKAMSEVYLQSVLASLRREMGAAADTTGIKKGWYQNKYPMSSGVGMYEDKDKSIYGVHGLKDFKLKFFEKGTRERETKGRKITGYQSTRRKRLERVGKGGNRGIIKANHFFTKGIMYAEENANETLMRTILQSIRNKGINIR